MELGTRCQGVENMNGNFKVICINSTNDTLFTENKTYEIKDGSLTMDNGKTIYSYINDMVDLEVYLCSEFEFELVSEDNELVSEDNELVSEDNDKSLKEKLLDWNKEYSIIVKHRDGEFSYMFEDRFLSKDTWITIDDYNSNLNSDRSPSCEVIAIYKVFNACKIEDLFNINNLELLWEKEAKKVTMKDIENKFGCRVEIVDFNL